MTEQAWYLDLFRGILSVIDSVVYDFINKLYQLFAYISQMTLFDDQIFKNFASRIYMVLGIVMLFKVAFSLITYLVNPDDLTDSNKGIGNVVKRIIISLVLLTFVPTIFTYAFRIQSIIVGDNILGNLILGDAGYNNDPDNANIQTTSSANNTDNNATVVDNGGKLMAFDILTAFYYIEPTVVNKNGYCKSKDSANEATGECNYGGDNTFDEDGSEHFNEIFNEPDSPYYHNVKAYLKYANRQVKSDGSVDIGWISEHVGTGYYGMHYSVILATIAGIFTLALLLTFCFDVALRAVKLAVLQLIAPIPILSYIEPKKGEGIMQKWIQESISTYVSLFIRLAILFFIIYFGSLISKKGIKILDSEGNPQNIEEAGYVYSMLAKAFIWMGLLMFAKEAPKLIGDLFGIKSDGFTMNPMKRFKDVPLVSGMLGAAGGSVLAAGSNIYAGVKDEKNPFEIARSAMGGLASGALHGGMIAEKERNPFHGAFMGAVQSSKNRNARKDGYGFKQRVLNKLTDMTGSRYKGGTVDMVDSKIYEERMKQNRYRQEYDQASNAKGQKTANGNASQYSTLQNTLNSMRDSGSTEEEIKKYSYDEYFESMVISSIDGSSDEGKQMITDAKNLYEENAKKLKEHKITKQQFDSELDGLIDMYNIDALNKNDFEDYRDLDSQANVARSNYEASEEQIKKYEDQKRMLKGEKK